LSEIDTFQDDASMPVGGERSDSETHSESLSKDDASADAVHSSSGSVLSDLVYPIALLRSALTAMHDLKTEISRTVLTSLATSLRSAQLYLPALHLAYSNLQNIGALPSGEELEIEANDSLHHHRPISTDYIGIAGSSIEQARLESSSAVALPAADETRMEYVRLATSLFARHAHMFNRNGGFISALYQMAEAESLRLTPRSVLDRVNETARLALKLPHRGLPFHRGTRDAIQSVGAWSIHVQSPLLWTADVKSISYAQNMSNGLSPVHSDQNSILAFLHRLKIWESVRSNLHKPSRILFRGILMSIISHRDLLSVVWNDLDVDSPHSIFADLTLVSHTLGPVNILGVDYGFLRTMMWAYRRRGETSRAMSLFAYFIDKINETVTCRISRVAQRRPLFSALETIAQVLLSGGPSPFHLRVIPRALVELMTRWVHVLEHGAEPVSNRVELEGLDMSLCNRIFASTALLHAHVKSDVLFDFLINSLRSTMVVRCTG
jgi:hypothetical protein